MVTNEGLIIRFDVQDISITGRDTQGVRLMRLDEGQAISTLSLVEAQDDEEEDEETLSDNEESVATDSEDTDRVNDSELSNQVDELIGRAEEIEEELEELEDSDSTEE